MDIFGLIILIGIFLLVGAGIALGLVGLGLLALFGGTGMTAVSVLIGFQQQNWITGMRVFLIQAGLASGVLAGGVTAFMGHHFLPSFTHDVWIIAIGATCGAVVGAMIFLLTGEAARLITQTVSKWATARVSWFTS